MIENELPFVSQSAGDNPGLCPFMRGVRTLHKGSKSSSSQATTNKDNSSIGEDEFINATDGGTGARDEASAISFSGKGYATINDNEQTGIFGDGNSVNIESLDAAIISEILDGAKDLGIKAFESNDETVNQAFDFGEEAIDSAFQFGEKSIAANTEVFGEALDFAENSSAQNANIINAATAGFQNITSKVVEGLFSDRADARESEEGSIIETLGKYSTFIFIGGAAAAAYAVAKRK